MEGEIFMSQIAIALIILAITVVLFIDKKKKEKGAVS